MSVILIMIPGAMVLAALGVWAFINAAKKGQFDDLDTPAIRAVFDDDDERPSHREPSHTIPHETARQDQPPPASH